MKKQTVTRVFLMCLLILSIAFLAIALSPYALSDEEQAVAQAQDLPTITTGNVEILRGKYFTVDVILSGNTLGLTSLDLFIDYDPRVMTLSKFENGESYQLGSALMKDPLDENSKGLGFNTNLETTQGLKSRPIQLFWNGIDPEFSNGTLVTLRFKSVTSSDDALLGKHYFTLSYRPENTFRTTPKIEGGKIYYQELNLEPGYVDVTQGKYQCTYFDWDGSEIVHFEENELSEFKPEEPEHPSRASTAEYYYTYTEQAKDEELNLLFDDDGNPVMEPMWDGKLLWPEDKDSLESCKWVITAAYTAHPQPYTVYYYFGEKDPETGAIDLEESPEYYYYTLQADGVTKDYCYPKYPLDYQSALPVIAQYTEKYYSRSVWYTDLACSEALTTGLVFMDTSDEAKEALKTAPHGVPLENTFKIKLYAYRQQNEDVIPPEFLDVDASQIECETLVDGTTVTVDINLTKNTKGIMSMSLILEYDHRYLTFNKVVRGSAFGSPASFDTTNTAYTPGQTPYRLRWMNSLGNYYKTGVVATLTFTLDPNAPVGEYPITLTYTPKQDVTRYYDDSPFTVEGTPDNDMLWYTTLNIVPGSVIVKDVEAPTEHEGNYYFNKNEQTYTFNTQGDAEHYNVITDNKRVLHGTQTVTVSLKTGDNVYRFWQAEEGRPREDIDFTFEILKRSVAIPTASSATYVYNHADQTYKFDNAGDSDYYSAEADSFVRKVVGTQTITCVLDYPEETYWGENEDPLDLEDKEYTFEIVRLRVKKPVSAGKIYTYDTTEQTYLFTDYGDAAYYTMPENADKCTTVAQSHDIVCTLNDKDNYCWDEEGNPTEPISFRFEMQKRAITAPSETTTEYVYSGAEKTYLFGEESQENKERYYRVLNNTATAAGTYTVTVELLHKEDTYWTGDETDVEDKTFDFVIEKQTVVAPKQSVQNLVFTLSGAEAKPEAQTYTFAAEEGNKTLYTVDDEARTKSLSGTTYIAVALKDKDNYKWSSTDASDDLSYPFVIAKKAVTKPVPNTAFTDQFEYTGSAIDYVLKNTTEKRYYVVTNSTRTLAGTYTGDDAVTVTLKYPDHCYWTDTDPQSSAALRYDFVIAQKQIKKPSAHSGTYSYNGEEQTYTFGSHVQNWQQYYTVTGDKATKAGTTQVIVSLNDKANYAWKPDKDEGIGSEDLSYEFTIGGQSVPVPRNKIVDGSEVKYYFTGAAVEPQFNGDLLTDIYSMEIDGKEGYPVNAGEHTVTFTLSDTVNYCWDDNTTDPKTIAFVILKRVITAPTANDQITNYTGQAQTFVFTSVDLTSEYYSCSETTFTDAGVYTITCSLTYPEETYWSTDIDDVADKTFTFTINKKKVGLIDVQPKLYTGELIKSGVADTTEYKVDEDEDEGGILAGTYTFKVKLVSANYKWEDGDETLEREFSFVISEAPNAWLVEPSISGWTYGETGTPGTATPKFHIVEGESTLVIEYRKAGTNVYFDNLPTDAGDYVARFYVPQTESYSGLETEKSFTVEQATLDMSEVAWDYESPFTYDGKAHTVLVTGLPDKATPTYTNNQNVNSGEYEAGVSFSCSDPNYKLGEINGKFVPACAYEILPCEVEIVWTGADPRTFSGATYTVPTAKFVDVNEKDVDLDVWEKDGKTFRNAGDYLFETVIYDDNYQAKNGTAQKSVKVAKLAVAAPVAHDDEKDPYYYTNAEQTYTFKSGFDSAWMTATGTTRTAIGSQSVTVDLIDKVNTYWAGTDESVEAISSYLFTIKKLLVTPPTKSDKTYVYNGKDQTYAFKTVGDRSLYTVENDIRKDNGTQIVTVSLNDPDNYSWVGVKESSDPLTFAFTIDKLAVVAPTEGEETYVYNGKDQTYAFKTVGDTEWFTLSGTSKKTAGSQDVTVVLKDKNNTYWADTEEETEDIVFTFAIAQAKVKAPSADETVFTFDGKEKTYALGDTEDSALYSLSGQRTKISSGTTYVTATLGDADNYCWTTGGSDPITFAFTVAKLAVNAPTADDSKYVYDGNVKTYAFKTAGDTAWYDVTGGVRTDANETGHEVKAVLKDKNNTYWANTEESVDDLTFAFVILKAEVTAPAMTTETYVYNGTEQTYVFGTAGDKDLISFASITKTNAGMTVITLSLIDPFNYRWAGTDGSEPLTYPFTILPYKVAKPSEDETEFFCNGKVQTYYVPTSTLYTVIGASKQEQGTTDVIVSLNDKANYVWDNAPEEDDSQDLVFAFTISHSFKNKIQQDQYKAADADCTHAKSYFYVCDCGAVGTDTYEVGEPLGHDYVVMPHTEDELFLWVRTDSEQEDYSAAYLSVKCDRCDYEESIKADLSVTAVPPGISNGLKTYVATVRLDRVYTETKEIVLPAVYHDFGDPVWNWSTDERGTVLAVAVFTCIDEGFENLWYEVSAVVTMEDNGDDTFSYVATAVFNGVDYLGKQVKTKPALTFVWGDGESDRQSSFVMPGDDVTDLIPEVPSKEGATFLKWWEETLGISLIFGENGYTPFVMRDEDRTFVALWKNIGQITVTVTDKEGASFDGCVVELKQGDEVIATLTTDDSGAVVFDELEYGNYSVVVTYTDGNSVTYTTGTVLGEAEKTIPVQMNEKRFSTEVKDDDGKNVSVENLENTVPEEDKEKIVTTGQEGDVAEITVVLSVVNETDPTVVEEMTDLIEAQDNKVIDLSDITLVKTVTVIGQNGEEVSTDSTLASSEELISITFPITEDIYTALAEVHGNVNNVLVARKDGDVVGFMTKCSEEDALASEEECYYVKEEEGISYVVVRAKTFSTTYGLCVSSDSVLWNNNMDLSVTDWTYGDKPIPATATATYGEPVIYYNVNGKWVTELPTDAGIYDVKAEVTKTTEYNGVTALSVLTIRKAPAVTVTFEDLSVAYDGEPHSIKVEGLPADVTVNYENNAQVDVGTYTVTAYLLGHENYQDMPAKLAATLTIFEEEESVSLCRNVWFWILLVIAIAETLLLILLLIRGRKYKKKYLEAKKEKENKEQSASAWLLSGLSSGTLLTINIVLLVVDIVLFGLLILLTLSNRKYKKKFEELMAENQEQPSEEPQQEADAQEGSEEKSEEPSEEGQGAPVDPSTPGEE